MKRTEAGQRLINELDAELVASASGQGRPAGAIERVSHRSSQVCVVTTFVKDDRAVSRLWL